MRYTSRFRAWGLSSVFLGIMIALMMIPGTVTYADEAEDGGITQHELFEFEAFIEYDDISDGTAPFDSNSQAGNDENDHNKIVRSFDTVTYPVKITVNPKKSDMLENIKLKLTGTLENGIADSRVNAKFAVGGIEDMETEKVSFTQEYTIERTGNSIMIPVTVEVKGAKPGVKLTPEIAVEVVSVDGASITGVKTVFDSLPSVTVSAKVNIKPYVGSGLTGQGIPYYPYAGMTNNPEDKENIQTFAVSWGIDRLPGKSSIRGSTFPDPDGEINFHIDLKAEVYWDGGPNAGETEQLDFSGRDTPFMLFDHRAITTDRTKVGEDNMLSSGDSYRFVYSYQYGAPRSEMPNLTESTIERWKGFSVWDSGDWKLSAPNMGEHVISYQGSNTDFVIGSTFPIYRSDGYDGSRLYGVNDKIFASHSFIMMMPNEYRIGGPNNPNNYANNVYYRAYVTLDSYVDEDGNTIEYNKRRGRTVSERNLPDGSFSVQTTFKAYPSSAQLGTPNIGWSAVSKGDASTLIGEDVYHGSSVGLSMPVYGGYRSISRWNTDAFKLTKEYAKAAERNIMGYGYRSIMFDMVRNNDETQNVLYGVAKFDDNSFDNFVSKGKDDYDWYDTYDEAASHGLVGAIQNHVMAGAGADWVRGTYTPLKVKHDNIGIGATTIQEDTANIAVTNLYVYLDKERNMMVHVTEDRTYRNPAIWDENGVMLKKQAPSGGSVNFETLAVTPAETASILDADKTTYYNSETIHWTAENSIVLPDSGVPEDLDAGVKVTHTLPKGLNYKVGSGKVGDEPTEPEVIKNNDGTTDLVWNLLVSNSTHKIEDVSFDTTINPFALDSGVQSSVVVKSVIESELDRRRVHLRTSTKSVTILKVGMVGIYESINKTYGDKNSSFEITLSPYTTIEDEKGVTGLTVIPQAGDEYGSDFSGTVELTGIDLQVDRKYENKDVKIYLNKEPIYSDQPHEIDTSKNGWYEYTGQASQLDDAKSLLFYVEGKMTSHDNIEIKFKVQTHGNNFGDKYLNQTVINSETDYRLSPVSNRVRYTIRADLELALERFQIYTNKASVGLPTSVRVAQTVLEPESVKNKEITLAIYETESGDKVAAKTYKQHELERENDITIPASDLEKGSHQNYEVRIEGYDKNSIWVKDGEGKIDTDGYTAQEGTLRMSDANADGIINFTGIVMTERELGEEMVTYDETLKINTVDIPNMKSGYGFAFDPNVTYTNDVMGEVANRIEDVTFSSDATLAVNHNLIDKSLAYYDANAHYNENDKVLVDLLRSETPGTNKIATDYQFVEMYLEQGTGLTYTSNQKINGEIDGEPVPAGHKLYIPVWIKDTGAYGVTFANKKAIGSHFMHFDLDQDVNVISYMFSHTDSDTPIKDELLIRPMEQDAIPSDW